jgi:hypothetical protein
MAMEGLPLPVEIVAVVRAFWSHPCRDEREFLVMRDNPPGQAGPLLTSPSTATSGPRAGAVPEELTHHAARQVRCAIAAFERRHKSGE